MNHLQLPSLPHSALATTSISTLAGRLSICYRCIQHTRSPLYCNRDLATNSIKATDPIQRVRMSDRMGTGGSKALIMPGAFPDDQPGKDDTYDSNVSGTNFKAAGSGCFSGHPHKAPWPQDTSEPEGQLACSFGLSSSTPANPRPFTSSIPPQNYFLARGETTTQAPSFTYPTSQCAPSKEPMPLTGSKTPIFSPQLLQPSFPSIRSSQTLSPLLFNMESNNQDLERSRRQVELTHGSFAHDNRSFKQASALPASSATSMEEWKGFGLFGGNEVMERSQSITDTNNPFDPFRPLDPTLFMSDSAIEANNDSGGPVPEPDVPNAAELTRSLIKTVIDLNVRVQSFLNLKGPEMKPLRDSLAYFHESAIEIAQSLRQTGEMMGFLKTDIYNTDEWTKWLEGRECGLGKFFADTEDKDFKVSDYARHSFTQTAALAAKKCQVEELPSELMHAVCVLLETFVQVNDHIWQKKVKQKMSDISNLRTQLHTRDETLKMTKEEVLQTQHQLTTAYQQLNDLKTTSQAQLERDHTTISDLQNQLTTQTRGSTTAIHTLTNTNRKLTQDHEAQIRGLTIKHSAELSSTNAKSERIASLETKIHDLEKQLADLAIAKATVDREYENLEPNVHYKEAYEQVLRERDELRGMCEDLKVERDELVEEKMERNTEEGEEEKRDEVEVEHVAKHGSSTMPHPSVSGWDRLDGLKEHWENRLKRTMDSVERKRGELGLIESEIGDAKRLLRPQQSSQHAAAPPPPPPPPPPPSVGSQPEAPKFQFLDVGVDPLVEDEAPAPDAADSKEATETPTQKQSLDWKAAVTGKPQAKPPQRRLPQPNDQQFPLIRKNSPAIADSEWKDMKTRKNRRG